MMALGGGLPITPYFSGALNDEGKKVRDTPLKMGDCFWDLKPYPDVGI